MSGLNLDFRQRLKKTVQWDKAYISITATKEVVAVPLEFDRSMKFKCGSQELELNQQAKLLIYESANGKMKAEMVTYIPDKLNSSDKFSGILIVEDWGGNRINRFVFQKNQVFKLVDKSSTSLGTTLSGDCMKIDWYLCDVDESGHTSNCQYMYSEYIGSCNQGLEPPGEGGYEEYLELERGATRLWTVLSGNPLDPTDTREIWSRERLRYQLVATEPEGGHFTEPYNTARRCDFCGMNDTWIPNYNWSRPDPQTQNLTVRSDLYIAGHYFNRENSNSWTMQSMPH